MDGLGRYSNVYRYGMVLEEFRSFKSCSMVATSIRSVISSSLRVSCITAVKVSTVSISFGKTSKAYQSSV